MKAHELVQVCPVCVSNRCEGQIIVREVVCNDTCEHSTHVEVLEECNCECNVKVAVRRPVYKSEESKYTENKNNSKAVYVALGVVAASAAVVGAYVWLSKIEDGLLIDELE